MYIKMNIGILLCLESENVYFKQCLFRVHAKCFKSIICEIDSDAVDRQKLGFLNFLKGTEVKVLI